MQYIVVIKHYCGTVNYGPFNSKSAARHWAINNWMTYEIRELENVD